MADQSKTIKELAAENAALKERIRVLETDETPQHKVLCRSDATLEAHRKSRNYLQIVLQTTQDGFWVVDMEGRVIDVNESYCRMSGYSREEILTMTAADLDTLEDLPEMRAHIERVVARGSEVFEARHRRKDGTVYDVEVSVSHLDRDSGMLFCFCRDISDRKQAEEKLKHRLIYEQMLSRISAMAVEQEDLERFLGDTLTMMGETLGVSRVYLFEHHHETDSMDNTVEWCAPEESPQKDTLQGVLSMAAPWWVATLREGGTICFSDIEDIPDEGAKDILRPQGIRSVLVVPLFVAGRYYGFIGFDACRFHREWPTEDVEILLAISRIISGAVYKKEAEEEIEGERQQLLSIFNSVEESIYISDPETYEILYVNRKLANTLQKDCIGGICYKEFQGLDEPCPFCTNDIILKNKPQAHYWEYYNLNLEKHFFIVDRLIEWPDGRNVRFEMATDITELKRAEEEKIELEHRLFRAQKLESIGTLAGGIAHDFNNLLMGIQGNASLMRLDLDPSHPHYERLRHVEESVASGADLTKQLLGFARGGRYEVKPTSMNDIVKKSSAMFGRTRKEITIHEKYALDPCTVEVDRAQLEQAFMNLFVNAWHAMSGGGDLFIETERVFLDQVRASADDIEGGWYVKVSVTDTGIGMGENTKERIFDPFFTTKGMGRGSGLGLATVYGIVKGHKGMINVYSEPGHGSIFTLYIPASEKNPIERKKSKEEVLRGTETILLVDDEKIVLDVSRDMLQSLGYQVYVAGSGQEAVALYREKKDEIDLVILDMIMPGISGGATFDQMREINPGVKVLLASGYSINGQAQTIMDRGCDGFIQKPFHLGKLSQIVREVLNN